MWYIPDAYDRVLGTMAGYGATCLLWPWHSAAQEDDFLCQIPNFVNENPVRLNAVVRLECG